MRRIYRLPLVVILLLGGLFSTIVLFPMLTQKFRYTMIRVWSGWLVRVLGIRIVMTGQAHFAAHQGPGMIAANHISWTDIFVINALRPASFVSKADVAAWPVVGTLVKRAGTLFLERGKRHAVHRAIDTIIGAVQGGRLVAVFPEGTTSDGQRLLPFHANLLEAAVRVPCPVLPFALKYTDEHGAFSPLTDYTGTISFVQSMWWLTGARRILAHVMSLPPIDVQAGAKRHDIAQQLRSAISAAQALPLEDKLPDIVRDLRAAQQ
jgi:1-acyl-sn-glycerol-3-phosphate acyltransferase